jgi:hypothetical protein
MNTVITNIIGYILLIPALFTLFHIIILTANHKYITLQNEYETAYLPIYYGLMAIAGAYLIKDKK